MVKLHRVNLQPTCVSVGYSLAPRTSRTGQELAVSILEPSALLGPAARGHSLHVKQLSFASIWSFPPRTPVHGISVSSQEKTNYPSHPETRSCKRPSWKATMGRFGRLDPLLIYLPEKWEGGLRVFRGPTAKSATGRLDGQRRNPHTLACSSGHVLLNVSFVIPQITPVVFFESPEQSCLSWPSPTLQWDTNPSHRGAWCKSNGSRPIPQAIRQVGRTPHPAITCGPRRAGCPLTAHTDVALPAGSLPIPRSGAAQRKRLHHGARNMGWDAGTGTGIPATG